MLNFLGAMAGNDKNRTISLCGFLNVELKMARHEKLKKKQDYNQALVKCNVRKQFIGLSSLVQNYSLSVQGFSIIIFKCSRSDTLQFNWDDFQSLVKQPMDFQSIVVEFRE